MNPHERKPGSSPPDGKPDGTAKSAAPRAFVPLCLAGFIAHAYNNAYMALVPTFAQDVGSDLIQAGLQGTVFLTAAVVLRFALGPLADHIGAKPVMALGLVSFALGSALFTLCETFWHILCARCVQAVGIAAFYPCATATVTGMSPEGRSGTFLGLYRFATSASLVVGPATAFAVVDAIGYRLCFALLACASLVALAFVLALPVDGKKGGIRPRKEEARTAPRGAPRAARGRLAGDSHLVALVLGATVLAALGYGLLFSFSATYLHAVGSGLNEGLYFTVVGLGGLVANPATGWLCDRVGRHMLLACWLACLGLGVAILGVWGANGAAAVTSSVLAGFGYAGTITTVLSIASSDSHTNRRSSLLSLQQNAIDLGIACASGAFGTVLYISDDHQDVVFSVWGLFTVLAAFALGALPHSLRLSRPR